MTTIKSLTGSEKKHGQREYLSLLRNKMKSSSSL